MHATSALAPVVRRVVIIAASLCAVLTAAAYAPFASSSSAQAAAVVTGTTKASDEVVYGKVTFNGHGQGGATVQVLNSNGSRVGQSRTNGKGDYRLVLHVKNGSYAFKLRAHGHTATVKHALSKGIHLRVSAKVLKRGFLFLPFFHY